MNELATRPRSILMFERLYLLAIVMEFTDIMLDLSSAPPLVSQLWVRIAAVLVSLLLVLLASRRRQRIAGLILAALFVVGLPMVATALQPGEPLEASVLVLVQIALQAVALLFLFKPASREWLARARSAGHVDTAG